MASIDRAASGSGATSSDPVAGLRRRRAAEVRGTQLRVALVDAHDPRVEQAAAELKESGTLTPLRVGDGPAAAGGHRRPGPGAAVLDAEELWEHPGFEALTDEAARRRRLSPNAARALRVDSLHVGVSGLYGRRCRHRGDHRRAAGRPDHPERGRPHTARIPPFPTRSSLIRQLLHRKEAP